MECMRQHGNGVAFQHAGTATAVPQPHDCGIEMEIDILIVLLQITVVGSLIEMLGAVREGTERERLVGTTDLPPMAAAVGQSQAGGVVMIATVLWPWVVDILLLHSAVPQSYGG